MTRQRTIAFLVVTLAVSIVLFAAYRVRPSSPPPQQADPRPQQDLVMPKQAETRANSEESVLRRLRSAAVGSHLRNLASDKRDDLYQRTAWLKERGYQVRDYVSYDDETLRDLARNDDPLAQIALARRAKLTNPVEALDLNRRATVHGMTSSIDEIVSIHWLIAKGQTDLIPIDEVSQQSREAGWEEPLSADPEINEKEAYVWALVQQMRGDPRGYRMHHLIQNLPAEDIGSICNKATRIYRQMAAKRASMGYQPFDNSTPPFTDQDISNFGSMCDNWPVGRPICTRAILSDGPVNFPVYKCSQSYSEGGG